LNLTSKEDPVDRVEKVHVSYVLGLLGAVIVILITVKWTTIPDLVQYFTFALTVTSIALSLLAIVYTIVSGARVGQNLESLLVSSKSVAGASEDIRRVSEVIQQSLSDLPVRMHGIEERLDSTHRLVRGLSSSQKASLRSPSDAPSDALVDSFLARSSHSGRLALLAMKRSFEHKITISFSEMKLVAPTADYAYGYLVAATSCGMLDFEYTNQTYTTTQIHARIASTIEEMVPTSISRLDDPGLRKTLEGIKTQIEDYVAARRARKT